ncbi:hypothetical protein [Mycolicibacterium tokaiense]|uniref:hypothetical protein n=1 Tax=Mycolicibacterium tokaiense TaxID=39695 RepID=UPI0021F2BE37|nr:hypothetical protein [Mycolicibacterium tokaiense]
MFEECDPGALLTEVESSRLDESAVWAHRMAAIAALLAQRMNEGYDHRNRARVGGTAGGGHEDRGLCRRP